MVVLAAIIVVVFLTNTSLDRTTAGSVTDRYKAELAAQSGLEAAKQALFAYPTANPGVAPEGNPRTQNDHFIVTSSTDPTGVPYFFVGCAKDPNNSGAADDYTKPAIEYFPLYSGGKLQSGLTITGGAAPTPALTLAAGTVAMQKIGSNTTYYPLLFSSAPHSTWQPNIRTNWQPALTPAGSTTENYRFTYWIEDLSAYVDASVAGNIDDSGTKHIRSFGYDPKEVALFSLFSPTSQFDPGTTYAKTLVQNHQLFFTRLTTRLGTTTPSSDNTVCTTSLTANLQNDGEQTLIPFGLGYKNQGQLKTNVNTVIKNSPNDTGVTQVAKAISDNLPNFASSRQGSLSDDYDKTLAANIIGYGSATNTPLVGTGYRGITLMPFVTEVFEMYYWAKAYYPQNGTYFVDIEVKTYVQLWNMFNQDITSGTLTFTDKLTAGLKFGSSGISSFDKGTQSSPNTVSIAFTSSSPLKSNEYRPVLASDITYTIDTGSTVQPTGSIDISDHVTPTSGATDQDSSYTVFWNGVPYDQPGFKAGSHLAMERNSTSLTKVGAISKVVGTVPALRYTKTSGKAPYLLGDPRMSYYINGTQYSSSYNGGTAWGGAVYMKTLVEGSGWVAGESRVGGWADGGHSSIRGVTPTTDPTSLSQNPTTVNPNPTIDATKAPARSSNRPDGRIYSITELGYIYDPFQWNPFASAPTTTTGVDNGWQGTWKTKFKNFPTAKTGDDDTYGSHSTLRIGRPEHKSFDVDGTRAWQLLDIFSTGDPADSTSSGGGSNQIRTRGRININTASSEVLRALAAGVQIGNLTLPSGKDVDPAIQPPTVYGPQTSNAADVFSADVIAQRNKQPFLSTSQLAALPGSNSEPFFGNSDQWPSNGPTQWNDAAAEEYFAKILNFTTVRSRNFRVFVTGQVVDPTHLDKNGDPRVIATANKVYQVFLKPARDPATGAITSQSCQVTYAADLPF